LQRTGGMTLEAWVNPTTVSNTWRDVIYKGNDNYYLEATSSNSSRPAGGGTFAGVGAEAYGPTALKRSTWSHIAATYDGSSLRLYVNRAQGGSQARNGSLKKSAEQLTNGGGRLYRPFFAGRLARGRDY